MTIKQKQYLWLDIDLEDAWFSSHYLIKNLKRCYQKKLGPNFHSLNLPIENDVLNEFITKNQITSVIIADPRINLPTILKNQEIEFFIHIIGSPLRKLEQLKQMKIENLKICLMVGSKANYEIVKNFSDGAVKYFPFLPDLKDQSEGTTKEIKNKFLYFGRLAFQKNLIALMELFSRYQSQINPNAELSLYGSACNSNFPTKPHGHYIGMSAETFFLKLAELQDKGHKIKYFGPVSHTEISKILSEHNTFISLSTAEEEDFGMSLYEAMGQGLSSVVSNWGGYREFQGSKQVSFVDVIHQEKTLYIDQDQLFAALEKENHRSRPDLDAWTVAREKIIHDLDLNFEPKQLNIKLERNFITEEFFNEYQEFVSPYWR